MAKQTPIISPFTTAVPGINNGATDLLPASYHYYKASGRRVVANPDEDVSAFLHNELSLGRLGEMLQHLWFAGAKHAPRQLHFQVAVGREIVVVDRMDLHLVWDKDGKIFLKPIPRFLLDPEFWQENLKCPYGCMCPGHSAPWCRDELRKVALGFLYTYACLISSESDFFLANEKRLLPRKAKDAIIEWAEWKIMARELLSGHDPENVHPRFLRAELRLSRINTINRFTRFPPFQLYLSGWNNYGSFYRDNVAWMAATTVFVALVLAAMQVGLATERLQGSAMFQNASSGFTVFCILGPICAFGLMIVGALLKFFITDLPAALKHR
ncbi:hypothetical protein F5883DRAFT_695198 [Diaporthe sp. PMI_573]|nr:hypothetical protein F5883DRAFT_695198 [Diaporthaceae sp. PMI_573]